MPVLPSSTQVVSPNLSAKKIIKRALRIIGAKQSNEEPTPSEYRDALEALNDMLDSWNTEHLVVYATVRSTFTLVASQPSFTIGIGEDLAAPRPSRIDNVGILLSGQTNEYGLRRLTDDEWAAVLDKTLTGTPCAYWFDGDKTIHFDYIPDGAHTLVLYTWQQLSQIRYAALSENFTLPTGYARAIVFCLAIDLAPEWQKQVSADIVNIAITAKANMKRLNIKPLKMRCDAALVSRSGRSYDIRSNTNR